MVLVSAVSGAENWVKGPKKRNYIKRKEIKWATNTQEPVKQFVSRAGGCKSSMAAVNLSNLTHSFAIPFYLPLWMMSEATLQLMCNETITQSHKHKWQSGVYFSSRRRLIDANSHPTICVYRPLFIEFRHIDRWPYVISESVTSNRFQTFLFDKWKKVYQSIRRSLTCVSFSNMMASEAGNDKGTEGRAGEAVKSKAHCYRLFTVLKHLSEEAYTCYWGIHSRTLLWAE